MLKGRPKSNKEKTWGKVVLAILPALIIVAGFFAFANPTPKTLITPSVQNGLVGYWNMDSNDISGSTLYDKSGTGNHGTIYGATSTPGKIKQALQFGGDDYVEVPDNSTLDITDEITIEAWIYDPPLNEY